MGREGGGRAREEAEEVEGRDRGAGEGAGLTGAAVGLRHHPQVARRKATGECRFRSLTESLSFSKVKDGCSIQECSKGNESVYMVTHQVDY